MNAPSPEQRSAGALYEGRMLPRPDDELVDQGLAFDLGTLLSRRRLLGVLSGGAAAAALAACSIGADTPGTSGPASGGATTEIPDETAGPFPGDGSNGPDALSQSGIVRSDIRSSIGTGTKTAEGVPLRIELTILDLARAGAAFGGVAVYVWHCDAAGSYSMYAAGLENENYLRGVQAADPDGVVRFSSVYPAAYSGRWPHVHFEVYPDLGSIADAGRAIATSQLAFPRDACAAVYASSGYPGSAGRLAASSLQTDNVFGDDGGVHQLATMSGDASNGFLARLTVPVDTRTAPVRGNAPPGSR